MTNIPVKKDNENINIDYLYSLMNSEVGKVLEHKFFSEPTYNFLITQTEQQINFKKQLQQEIFKFKNIDKLIDIIYSTINKFSSFMDDYKSLFSSDNFNGLIDSINNISNDKNISK